MVALDTNFLLRLLLGDDPDQARRVKEQLLKAQHADKVLYVPQVVVQELVWQLQYEFKVPRAELVRMLDGMFTLPVLQVEAPARIARAIRVFAEHPVDFADACLAAISHEKGLDGVLSFDRDMGRIGARWIRP